MRVDEVGGRMSAYTPRASLVAVAYVLLLYFAVTVAPEIATPFWSRTRPLAMTEYCVVFVKMLNTVQVMFVKL